MSNVTEFQLGIRFPNKSDETYTVKYVYFSTDEEREKYIRDEFNYCKNEEKSYISALYDNQRISAVHSLYNKRIEFAKNNNLKIVG